MAVSTEAKDCNSSVLTDTGENVQKWTRDCIFESALSHTRRWDASEKKKKILESILVEIRQWTSFEFSPVSVK